MAIERHLGVQVWKDYLSLAKPRIVILHIITAAAAMCLAAGGLTHINLLFFTLLGGGLVAGASNVVNCYIDCDIDQLMLRTRKRPLPSKRLNPSQALIFGISLGLVGLFMLSWMVNWIVALLALGAFIYYIFIYTIWLKRRTYWGVIIGSGAGAFPPLIGWVAVTGSVGFTPFLLFTIIALWTPPHFWSLAIFRNKDYELAGIRVIPSSHRRVWIAAFVLALILVSISLFVVAHLGTFYIFTVSVLDVALLIQTGWLILKENSFAALRFYWYSIIYLVLLFGAIFTDRILSL